MRVFFSQVCFTPRHYSSCMPLFNPSPSQFVPPDVAVSRERKITGRYLRTLSRTCCPLSTNQSGLLQNFCSVCLVDCWSVWHFVFGSTRWIDSDENQNSFIALPLIDINLTDYKPLFFFFLFESNFSVKINLAFSLILFLSAADRSTSSVTSRPRWLWEWPLWTTWGQWLPDCERTQSQARWTRGQLIVSYNRYEKSKLKCSRS